MHMPKYPLAIRLTPGRPNPSLPLAFYLKLFQTDITARERLVAYVVMIISIALSVVGTVWAFLPKSLVGAG